MVSPLSRTVSKRQQRTRSSAPRPHSSRIQRFYNSDNDDTGNQDPPSGDQGSSQSPPSDSDNDDNGSPQSPPSGGRKTKCHRAQSLLPQSKRRKHRRFRSTPSDADLHSGGQSSPLSDGHNPRARKHHASRSYSPPSKRQRRHPRSILSESDMSPPWHRRHQHRDSSLSSSSTSSYTSSSQHSSSTTNTTIKGEGTAANGDDSTVLVNPEA